MLEKLISFDTVSSNSNLELLSFCEKILKDAIYEAISRKPKGHDFIINRKT